MNRFDTKAALAPDGMLLSSVQPEVVSWIWEGRIPLGMISIVDGDPGLGKSTMLADLSARVSNGGLTPTGESIEPGGVILITTEDSPSVTIRPRMEAAGADLNRIRVIPEIELSQTRSRPFCLPDDLNLLKRNIRLHKANLVIIDPIMAHLGSDVNSFRDQDVRAALAPLATLADETGVAVILVRHLNKTSGTAAIYRGGGSIGIIGLARVGMLVGVDPNDGAQRLLAITKCNVAKTADTISFRIGNDTAAGGASCVEWGGVVNISANQIVNAGPSASSGEQDFVRDVLLDILEDGPQPMKDVEALLRAEGISTKQARRVLRQIGGTKKVGVPGKRQYWAWYREDRPSHRQ